MEKQIYVIENTVTTQVWFYKGEVVNEETIFHICGSTRIGNGNPSHLPDVEVKSVEQQVLVSVSTYCYTGPSRAKFVKEEDEFALFDRRPGDSPWGFSWKFPVKRCVGNLVVLDKAKGEYRQFYFGNDPKKLEADCPWKPVNPSNPIMGFEGWGRNPCW